jgi:hypothetical protein
VPEPVHVHAPHELEESHDGGHAGVPGRERNIEIVAAFLLAITTLAIAWSGYQAAKWSGLQARHFTEASSARAFANREQTQASQARLQDVLNFNRWLEAEVNGDTAVANLYERRFREEFLPAFNAWRAQGDPLDPNIKIPTPLKMPQYVLAGEVKAETLEALGDRRFAEGKEATETADKYVFATVFFAVVLFLSGVSLRFDWWRLRVAMVAGAAVFLVWGIVQLASLPVH